MVARGRDHLLDALFIPDVAGIDAQAGRAGLGGLDAAAIVEMDVGDDRHRAFAHDFPERVRELASSGTLTRTISAPASAAACTCAMVPGISVVSVLVMVWTEIGASPPTGTLPTMI